VTWRRPRGHPRREPSAGGGLAPGRVDAGDDITVCIGNLVEAQTAGHQPPDYESSGQIWVR
jgi:hypothetical protein